MREISEASGPLEASVFVEGLRAIPAAFLGIGLAFHALVWSMAMQIAETSPPPQMAVALALGREWLAGYAELPPLGAWISAAIFYLTHSFFMLRLASAFCVALAGWLVFLFARRIFGERHGAIAVLLMVSVFPVALPGNPLTGDVLQMPLAAGAVFSWWLATAERKPNAWIALGVILGVMNYAGPQGLILFAVLTLLTVSSARGRAAIKRFDALSCIALGLFVFVFISGPRFFWLWQHGFTNIVSGHGAGIDPLEAHAPLRLVFDILFGHFGFAMLLFLATAYAAKENAPVFMREPAALFSRRSVIVLAIAPMLLALLALYAAAQPVKPQFFASLLLFSGVAAVAMAGEKLILRRQRIVGVIAAIFLLVPPLAQIVFSFTPGWFGENRAVNWPVASAARTLTDIYHTRTGRPLEFLIGERVHAAQVAAVSADQPHIFIGADISRSPWIDAAEFRKKGGVVFWEISGADSSPPADYVAKLPAFVAEAPLRLPWARGGGDPVRLGWAIVPPQPTSQ